jgi:tetratricopeptide (TPR) repeat protein
MKWPLQAVRRAVSAVGAQSPRFQEHIAQGDQARDARDWEGAIVHYTAALEANPAALVFRVQVGHCLKEAGRFAEAETQYQAFLSANPEDPDINLQLGHLFMVQGRVEEARPWYEKALAIAPAGGEIVSDARRGLDRCADASLEGFRRAALDLVDRRRFAAAHERLVSLVEDHGCEDLAAILGNVCKELGRSEEARGWYARRRQAPDGATPDVAFDIELQLGHLAKTERNYAAAIAHFAAARRLLPQVRKPSATDGEFEGELRICLSEVTSSITLS